MDTNDCSSEGRREEEGSKAELPPLTPVYYPGRCVWHPQEGGGDDDDHDGGGGGHGLVW